MTTKAKTKRTTKAKRGTNTRYLEGQERRGARSVYKYVNIVEPGRYQIVYFKTTGKLGLIRDQRKKTLAPARATSPMEAQEGCVVPLDV